jgi:integrase
MSTGTEPSANSETCDLNLGDLDFARGTINVRDAKTEAGIRKVDIGPWLREELLTYRASRVEEPADAPAFPTRTGSRRNKDNVNQRVLRPAVRAANELRSTRREPTLPTAAYLSQLAEAAATIWQPNRYEAEAASAN